MPKPTSEVRGESDRKQWCGTLPSRTSRIEDLETRLRGMQEALDLQFQRIGELQMRIERASTE